ncbi:radical SAM protein [Collinsella sp. zg1085]|uniref:radical SAM protein n=1 Tax=Collinsella sp. zg1085 TaxID=2844380 RepID=UPI001C0AAB24|nr:radical SAM protein [Collinsella sp. zg1085]QWT17962.1 radical SAM protein [Collinsella sp. zg1085]
MPLLTPQTLERCELCPRRCHANRAANIAGACGSTSRLKLARAARHLWEEPPISGTNGSGTIFFSGCPLACVFCQNHEISTGNFGLTTTEHRLVEIMLELQEQGVHNINLVTATHWAHLLPHAITEARRRGLSIPIVYNTSGYELPEAIHELGNLIDVWLTDFKYADPTLGAQLSRVQDYPSVAIEALAHMMQEITHRGGIRYTNDGLMTQGIIVRHLVLPGHTDDSLHVLDHIWNTAGDVPISVMNQYTPNTRMKKLGGNLARALSTEEYELVLDYADDRGFTNMFWQEGGTVDESFTPAFDTTGIERKADS